MDEHNIFVIDKEASDHERLYVDIQGLGTVLLNRTEDGLVIDAYPFHVVDEPIFTTWLLNSDFAQEEK